jgi:predicted DNA-binding protein
MRTISLRLPDDLLANLDDEARKRGMTKSALVRESLERAFHQSPEAQADNPKYL